jgi:hypothetical protein
MGLNEVGFGIINSNSYNLGDNLYDGVNDGILLRMALERCRTLRDLEDLLDFTGEKGRRDCWNIGAFDAEGNAALYECSNRDYVKYDANDPEQAPDGIILRTTFSLSGAEENRVGLERYKRVCQLVHGRDNENPVDVEFVLQKLSRDLANPIADPYPLPYSGRQNNRQPGFIYSHGVTINRDNSRSCMVIRGVRPEEDPRLGTIFTSIGAPVVSLVYPLWVASCQIPSVLNFGIETAMYSLVSRHRANLYPHSKDPFYLDSRYLVGPDGDGIFSYTLPLEREVIKIADDYLTEWSDNYPSASVIVDAQNGLAEYIFDSYSQIPLGRPEREIRGSRSLPEIASYPNPFNARAYIRFSGFDGDDVVQISVYDILGREIKRFDNVNGIDGSIIWNGDDNRNRPVASGVYLIRATGSHNTAATKTLLMK